MDEVKLFDKNGNLVVEIVPCMDRDIYDVIDKDGIPYHAKEETSLIEFILEKIPGGLQMQW